VDARKEAATEADDAQQSPEAADQARRVVLPELNVQVRDGEVRTVGVTWKTSHHLGRLAGASAGVTDEKQLSTVARLRAWVLGTSPRVGTIFVKFADGTRHETPLRLGTDERTQALNEAIARFNALANAAAK
jgi:hypothetical protein